MPRDIGTFRSHGNGQVSEGEFDELGTNVVIENGVMVFNAQNIRLGNNVYIGHQTILKGYHKNWLIIGHNTWIGQQCFIHSAGGITIGSNVGIGPGVKIISSSHEEEGIEVPILASRLTFASVTVGNDCDLGVGSIILPGIRVGRGVQIGAGSVVTRDIPDYAVVAGAPARVLRLRKSATFAPDTT